MMKSKRVGVAKMVAVAVVPLGLASVVAKAAQQRRTAVATWRLLGLIRSLDGQFNVAELEEVVRQGANVNVHGRAGTTALHRVAYSSSRGVRVLLDNGAAVNAREDDGNTPLLCAVSTGNVEVVRLLLQRGADANPPRRWPEGGTYSGLRFSRNLLRSENRSGNSVYLLTRMREIIQLLKAAGAKE